MRHSLTVVFRKRRLRKYDIIFLFVVKNERVSRLSFFAGAFRRRVQYVLTKPPERREDNKAKAKRHIWKIVSIFASFHTTNKHEWGFKIVDCKSINGQIPSNSLLFQTIKCYYMGRSEVSWTFTMEFDILSRHDGTLYNVILFCWFDPALNIDIFFLPLFFFLPTPWRILRCVYFIIICGVMCTAAHAYNIVIRKRKTTSEKRRGIIL